MHERLDGRDVDDAPFASAQGLEEGMRHVEHADEIDRDDVFPVLDDGRSLAGKGVAAIDAGIVDEDRDLPDLFADELRDINAVVALRDVEPVTGSPATRATNIFRSFLRRLRIDIEEDDLRAFFGVTWRDGEADAGGCSRDDGDMVFEKSRHRFLHSIFRESLTTLSRSPQRFLDNSAQIGGNRNGKFYLYVVLNCAGGSPWINASRNGSSSSTASGRRMRLTMAMRWSLHTASQRSARTKRCVRPLPRRCLFCGLPHRPAPITQPALPRGGGSASCTRCWLRSPPRNSGGDKPCPKC